MKIEGVRIYLVSSGKLHPVIVEIATDEGIAGIGEAAIAYGLGGTAAAGMIKDLAERIIVGRDPAHRGALVGNVRPLLLGQGRRRDRVRRDQRDRAGALGHQGQGARRRGPRAARRPDEGRRSRLRQRLVRRRQDAGAIRAGGRAAAARRLPRVEVLSARRRRRERSAPRQRAHGRPRLRQPRLREDQGAAHAVGADIELMLDLSGGLTTAETIRLCRRFEELDIAWIEEPADPFDAGALAKIAERREHPDRRRRALYTRHGFRKVFEAQAADIVQPDVGNTGGIMEAKKIAAMAEAYGMRVAPHNCASALSTAASLQVSACIANFMTLEIYPYFPERPGTCSS